MYYPLNVGHLLLMTESTDAHPLVFSLRTILDTCLYLLTLPAAAAALQTIESTESICPFHAQYIHPSPPPWQQRCSVLPALLTSPFSCCVWVAPAVLSSR